MKMNATSKLMIIFVLFFFSILALNAQTTNDSYEFINDTTLDLTIEGITDTSGYIFVFVSSRKLDKTTTDRSGLKNISMAQANPKSDTITLSLGNMSGGQNDIFYKIDSNNNFQMTVGSLTEGTNYIYVLHDLNYNKLLDYDVYGCPAEAFYDDVIELHDGRNTATIALAK